MTTYHILVPRAWLGKFIGHQLYFRPEGAGEAGWHTIEAIKKQPSPYGAMHLAYTTYRGQLRSGPVPFLCSIKTDSLPENYNWQPPETQPPMWPTENPQSE